jgi:hypothetical protein
MKNTNATATNHTPVNFDDELMQFIEQKLDSLVKWDLIQFFYRKPSLLGPAPKIASLTGRDLRQVEGELKEMAASGLLTVQQKSGVRLYRLTDDNRTRHLIQAFVNACDDRKFREAVIYQTVRKR